MNDIYTDGTYLIRNPTWHEEDSSWKAAKIKRMLGSHALEIRSVAEIGCGTGGILAELHRTFPAEMEFHGFDIAPEAIARAKRRETDRLRFYQEDLLHREVYFDLLLVIDVVEHVPDYIGFLKECRRKAKYKLYHIPLDIHVSSVLRASFAQARSNVGHIHYFSNETAIATLLDTEHTIIDKFYTDGALTLSRFDTGTKQKLANIPRRLVSPLSTAWAARLFGGYSLMVLTE